MCIISQLSFSELHSNMCRDGNIMATNPCWDSKGEIELKMFIMNLICATSCSFRSDSSLNAPRRWQTIGSQTKVSQIELENLFLSPASNSFIRRLSDKLIAHLQLSAWPSFLPLYSWSLSADPLLSGTKIADTHLMKQERIAPDNKLREWETKSKSKVYTLHPRRLRLHCHRILFCRRCSCSCCPNGTHTGHSG